MEKIVATVSHFATAEDYNTLSETVEEIDYHVKHLHDSLLTFASDYYEEKTKYTEELDKMKRDIHKLKVALTWTFIGLMCSAVGILGLCAHILS